MDDFILSTADESTDFGWSFGTLSWDILALDGAVALSTLLYLNILL